MGKRPSAPFRWGSEYTHALYALSATPPFEPLAASGEFCIAAAGTNDACESIQMVMALTRAKRAEPGLGRRPPIIVPFTDGAPKGHWSNAATQCCCAA